MFIQPEDNFWLVVANDLFFSALGFYLGLSFYRFRGPKNGK